MLSWLFTFFYFSFSVYLGVITIFAVCSLDRTFVITKIDNIILTSAIFALPLSGFAGERLGTLNDNNWWYALPLLFIAIYVFYVCLFMKKAL